MCGGENEGPLCDYVLLLTDELNLNDSGISCDLYFMNGSYQRTLVADNDGVQTFQFLVRNNTIFYLFLIYFLESTAYTISFHNVPGAESC